MSCINAAAQAVDGKFLHGNIVFVVFMRLDFLQSVFYCHVIADAIAAQSVDKLKGLHRVELQGKKSLQRLAIVILFHIVPPDVNSRAAASAGFWRL